MMLLSLYHLFTHFNKTVEQNPLKGARLAKLGKREGSADCTMGVDAGWEHL